jgi:thiosulfate reductase cytochrome b subunit
LPIDRRGRNKLGMGSDSARRPQPWPIRLAHWVNVPALVILAGSGLQILAAYPAFGPQGATFDWYPFNGHKPPGWLTLGGWLAGARALHFALAWLFVGNGLLYLAYLLGSGEWRRRMFDPRHDTRGAIAWGRYYLRLRKERPEQGLYNPLQRFAYTSSLALAALQVLSGLAIYKPVQLPWLVAAFGGYDAARFVHFAGLIALALFTIVHVVQVALHPRTLGDIVTGGKRP